MSEDKIESQTSNTASDKEFNFRRQAEAYEKKLSEKEERLNALERRLEELASKDTEQDSYDPYIDEKKLAKKLEVFKKQTQQETQAQMEAKLQMERDQMWLQQHNDFKEVMKPENLHKLYEKDPELAQSIMEMPDTFSRQKIVYKNVKAFGLDKPAQTEKEVQAQIEKNRRNVYYQPSGIANAPYQSTSDFSAKGQAEAYAQMQELKQRLRLG